LSVSKTTATKDPINVTDYTDKKAVNSGAVTILHNKTGGLNSRRLVLFTTMAHG
jgi:hypothetical protein